MHLGIGPQNEYLTGGHLIGCECIWLVITRRSTLQLLEEMNIGIDEMATVSSRQNPST